MTVPGHDGWRVRVRAADGTVHGAGVLVAPDLVLTCAHVVAQALRTSNAGPRPTDPVTVDFPTVAHAGRVTAHVDVRGWLAAAPDRTGDLAILRLSQSATVPPAALAPCGPPTRRAVRTFGHPSGDLLGRWAYALISGTAGPTGEWVQLNDPHQPGPRIERGYSGAGVVDESGAVIGVVVGVDRQESARGAWMVTVEAVAARLPLLTPLVNGSHPSRIGAAGPAPRRSDGARAEYEHQLVECLLALEGIEDRAHRDDLVTVLERGLDRPLGAHRTDRTRSDVFHIVVACLDHAVGNALAHLVDAARALHGHTAAVSRLARVAARDPGRRLSQDEVERLRALVAELPADHVVEASRAAFGVMGPRIDLDAGNLAEVMRALSELMGSAGQSPPLVVFLRRLADRLHGPPSSALQAWVEHIAQRWQVPVEDPAPQPAGPDLPPPEHSYLVVELREDGPNPDQYLLSIWLQHDDADGHALLVNDDQPLTLQEIPGYVGEHLRRVTRRWIGPIGELTIEFVLPYRLLDHEVDQFRVVLDQVQTPIGAAYPVVVRSLDRMTNQMISHRWQTRSNWLRAHQRTHDARAVCWVQLDGIGRQALEDELSRDPNGYSESFPVCLVLATAPRAGRSAAGTARGGVGSAMRSGLEIGMPVMVWCRHARLTGQFLAVMANQLNGRALADLPGVVQRLRHEATLSPRADHLGLHISLLWDLAHRLPPSQALRAPS